MERYCTAFNPSSDYGAQEQKRVQVDHEFAGDDTESLGSETMSSEEEEQESDEEEEEEESDSESEEEEELEVSERGGKDYLDMFFAKHRQTLNLGVRDVFDTPSLVGITEGSYIYVKWSPTPLYARVDKITHVHIYTNGRVKVPVLHVSYAITKGFPKGLKEKHAIVDDRRLYDLADKTYLTWFLVKPSSEEHKKVSKMSF